MNISITLETMAKTAQMQTPELLRNIDRWAQKSSRRLLALFTTLKIFLPG